MNYDTKIDTPVSLEADADARVIEVHHLDDTAERPSRRRLWLIGGAVVLVLLVAWLLMRSRDDKPVDPNAGAQVPVVSVSAPGRASIAGEITGTGSIAARREMPVGAVGEGGQVVSVLVDAGDWVRKGQPLAVIDRSVQVEQAASLAAQVDVAAADARLA